MMMHDGDKQGRRQEDLLDRRQTLATDEAGGDETTGWRLDWYRIGIGKVEHLRAIELRKRKRLRRERGRRLLIGEGERAGLGLAMTLVVLVSRKSFWSELVMLSHDNLTGEHQVPTPMDELTTDNKKKLSLNAKALNVLFCALGQDEFARVSSCKSAKEAWKLLEATHEGDKDTKATKIALGTSEYENFKMKAGESVQDMNKRFNLIVNNLTRIQKHRLRT
ncbi:unnamed protein product [Cuscuta campestris]|uniref:UBN2 domain-containing protein n=1 Tax=Cuscuta campestris TaxID=132261 RepID=A0A484MB09_9ASTE|nr:unnamed protein product [Cuscuta campestris]